MFGWTSLKCPWTTGHKCVTVVFAQHLYRVITFNVFYPGLNLKTTKAPAEDQQLLPQQRLCHQLFIIVPPAGVQKLPTLLRFTLSSGLHPSGSRRETPGVSKAWSAWTTGPTATWPGRWSASWTARAMGPGWTRATVALLHRCPELSAPSTTLSLCSRAPWTACTNWTPPARSTSHPRNHYPPKRVWWRSEEAAALLSKVQTTRSAEFPTVFGRLWQVSWVLIKLFLMEHLLSLISFHLTNNNTLVSWLHYWRLKLIFFCAGLWGTTLTENTSDNRELFVRTTLRELLVYLVFLVDICLCKCSAPTTIRNVCLAPVARVWNQSWLKRYLQVIVPSFPRYDIGNCLSTAGNLLLSSHWIEFTNVCFQHITDPSKELKCVSGFNKH